jgi:hypothetical protein
MVSMCLDGWSSVHIEPIVGFSAELTIGATYLIDSVDKSEYPTEVATESIQNCKLTSGAEVRCISLILI